MILRINSLLNVVKWRINLPCAFTHKNKQRLKVKIDVPRATTSKALDLKASKNRENWEKQTAAETALNGKVSLDDVFFTNEYETVKHQLTAGIVMHKEHCLEPSMLNAPYAILKANFLFNMRTKKTTRFTSKIYGVVVLPHELTFIGKKKVIAFCKAPEDIEIAMQCGAMDAGDESLVHKLEQGLINYEEFDQAVCHIDALALLSKIKPILKDKLPHKQSPRSGTDMKTLVHSFVNGYEYESRKIEGVHEESHLNVPLGEIGWPTEHLEKNYLAFMTNFFNNVPSTISGDLIIKSTLTCAPSDEVFAVDISEHVSRLKKDTKPLPRRSKKEVEELEEEVIEEVAV